MAPSRGPPSGARKSDSIAPRRKSIEILKEIYQRNLPINVIDPAIAVGRRYGYLTNSDTFANTSGHF